MGGEATIQEREGNASRCAHCGVDVRLRNVLNMNGPDYTAWLPQFVGDGSIRCTSPDGNHEGIKSWEVIGTLKGYDVHMFVANLGQPDDGGNNYFTVRAISKRGHHDPFSDYNPGGWTFCNRLADLEWACGR